MTAAPAFRIDLNADLGEGGPGEHALYSLVSSASIACGGHAGNEASMREALRACRSHGVTAGAHPGFDDPEGFGRRRLDQPLQVTLEAIRRQIALLLEIAAEEGTAIAYLKLHGALHNMASESDELATTLFSDVARHFPGLAILAMENTAQERAARRLGLSVVTEAYADRGYTPEGLLASRGTRGALLTDPAVVVERCIRLARDGEIVALDGTVIPSAAQSICLHGDTPHALELARAVHEALSQFGQIVSPLR